MPGAYGIKLIADVPNRTVSKYYSLYVHAFVVRRFQAIIFEGQNAMTYDRAAVNRETGVSA